MQVSRLGSYQQALLSLDRLKSQLGITPDLQAIAQLLIEAHDAELPKPRFPYVGDRDDPRDRAVIQAHLDAWEVFLSGDDDDYD